jgi:hypothetical protein
MLFVNIPYSIYDMKRSANYLWIMISSPNAMMNVRNTRMISNTIKMSMCKIDNMLSKNDLNI